MCPSSLPESASAEVWSREQEKAFENALANLLPSKAEKGDDDRWWEKLASSVPAKPLAEVRRHYEFLVEDVRAIEAGKVAFPCYVGEDKDKDQRQPPPPPPQQQQMPGFADRKELGGSGGGTGGGGFDSGGGHGRGGLSKAEQERRKGIPWTEEEHKLFLLGLSKFGKGDWRSISRNFVISRTPTQVASHAQKYFIRLNSMNRDRRRSSIHDITSLNGGDVASPQGPITGQNNGAVVGSPAKQPPQPNMPAMGMYGPPVGQPVPGHMVSAVGTPIMLPPPGHPPYMVPMAYPLHPPPPAMHQ